ncbi:MAG: hypothetical protein J0H52_15520 [Comamonadaceae bacterium]|nr:hypothetical protein [Comamonadaceae bacterium]
MSRWFSVRGARRGIKLSALAVALWLSWAVGFTQGSAPVPPGAAHAAPPSSSPPCCQPVPST